MGHVSKAKNTLLVHFSDIQCHFSHAAYYSHAFLVFFLSGFAWLSAVLAESLLHKCRAGVDGGANFVDGNGATLSNVTTCAFTSNTAQGDGGACTFNGGATILTSNHFELNHAGSRGGAVAYTYQCFVPGQTSCCSLAHSSMHEVQRVMLPVRSWQLFMLHTSPCFSSLCIQYFKLH